MKSEKIGPSLTPQDKERSFEESSTYIHIFIYIYIHTFKTVILVVFSLSFETVRNGLPEIFQEITCMENGFCNHKAVM
jgi:hypothetical protein